MDCGCGKKRMKVEGDRISNLPDDVIHKILSFIGIKEAIKTSGLSSRWRNLWTSMPYLNFSNKGFQTLAKFSKFVKDVLSSTSRNDQMEVSSVNLSFHGKISQVFVKRILDMIFNSHNVQQLKIIICSGEKGGIVSPVSLFDSQSLKYLTLDGCAYNTAATIPTWDLTTLHLHNVTFYVDESDLLFSNFANLKNLTLEHCQTLELEGFNISHPTLSDLTLEDGYEDVIVVTPQLKNLTIRSCRCLIMITAPHLASLRYEGCSKYLQFSSDFLHLEKAHMCIWSSSSDFMTDTHFKTDAHKIDCLLRQLHTVEFLTLSWETVKLLSSSMELISHQPSPFVNLRCLKIYPTYVPLNMEKQSEVTMSTEVKKYLLDGSPGATFTLVSHEEIRALKNVTTARNLMTELHVLLDEWKGNIETNTSQMKKDKACIESHMATMQEQLKDRAQPETIMKSHFGERIAHMNKQFKKGYNYTGRVISSLQTIEVVLAKLPASDQVAKLQSKLYSLRAEAENIMDIMIDDLKIQN